MKYCYLLILLGILGCRSHEWNNPFDSISDENSFAPKNFNSTLTGNAVVLTWDLGNSNITGYRITKSSSISSSSVLVANVSNSTNRYIDGTIEDGVTYSYDIVAIAGTHYSTFLNTKVIVPMNPTQISLKNGMEVFYGFNNNANDLSGNGYNGTIYSVGFTTDRFGTTNSAVNFPNTNGYKILTNYYGITGNTSRTISLWTKISNKPINHSHILSYGGDPNNGQQIYSIGVSSLGANSPYIEVFGDGYIGNMFTGLYDGSWHHYVFVYDNLLGTTLTSIKIYIDGNLVQNNVQFQPNKINTPKNLPLVFGQFTSYNGAAAGDYRAFNGQLDDVGIWKRVLTLTEIQYLYQKNYKP